MGKVLERSPIPGQSIGLISGRYDQPQAHIPPCRYFFNKKRESQELIQDPRQHPSSPHYRVLQSLTSLHVSHHSDFTLRQYFPPKRFELEHQPWVLPFNDHFRNPPDVPLCVHRQQGRSHRPGLGTLRHHPRGTGCRDLADLKPGLATISAANVSMTWLRVS